MTEFYQMFIRLIEEPGQSENMVREMHRKKYIHLCKANI